MGRIDQVDKFMERAVELADENVRNGGQPFGAVIVKNNNIVAEGVNQLHQQYDISAHAEMLAIRKLQETLQTHDLTGYTMYASGEPCEMCLTAMYFTGIRDIYYSTTLKEAVDKGFEETEVMTDDDLNMMKTSMVYMPLRSTQDDPIERWVETVQKSSL